MRYLAQRTDLYVASCLDREEGSERGGEYGTRTRTRKQSDEEVYEGAQYMFGGAAVGGYGLDGKSETGSVVVRCVSYAAEVETKRRNYNTCECIHKSDLVHRGIRCARGFDEVAHAHAHAHAAHALQYGTGKTTGYLCCYCCRCTVAQNMNTNLHDGAPAANEMEHTLQS